jgi:hypothetical protein
MHHKKNHSLHLSDLHLLQDYIKRYGPGRHRASAQLHRLLENHMDAPARKSRRATAEGDASSPGRFATLFSGDALFERFLSSSESTARSSFGGMVRGMMGGGGKSSQGQQMGDLASAIARAMARNM